MGKGYSTSWVDGLLSDFTLVDTPSWRLEKDIAKRSVFLSHYATKVNPLVHFRFASIYSLLLDDKSVEVKKFRTSACHDLLLATGSF